MRYNVRQTVFPSLTLCAAIIVACFSLPATRTASALSPICGSSSCFQGVNYICVNQGCGGCNVGNGAWCGAAGHSTQ